jgi:hypothetical protein
MIAAQHREIKMKNPDEIKTEISDLQEKLEQINAGLASTRVELDKEKDSNADLTVLHLDRTRYQPKSITTSHRRWDQLEKKIERLENSRIKWEAKLASKQNELALAELYQSSGKDYLNQQDHFHEQAKSIKFAVANLKESIEIFNSLAAEFFANPTGPIDQLRLLSQNPLFAGVSLESFLLKGKIKTTKNGTENATFLDQQEKKLRDMATTVPLISEELLDELQWWVGALVQFTHNPASATRRNYVAPEKRPVQGITSQSFVVPPHARGGPEVSDDNPRSDRSFFKRQRFRKEFDATKPVGEA